MSRPDAALVATLRLARTEGVGPINFRRLLARFADPSIALAELPRLARAAGRDQPPRPPTVAMIETEIARLAALGGRFVCHDDPDYPPLLAELADAPPALAVLGDVGLLSAPAVAIVGARNASINGRRIAAAIAADLAAAGLVVVSGLARGIDTAAHEGALTTGHTIAAIAGGLDRPYPPENADLQARIATAGAVIAEAPLGTAPRERHFPRRNRLIAGLTSGTLVVEAAPRSGSLITARMAADAGRDIFAVPGSPLDPRHRGTNGLLRNGAILTETAADILAEFSPGHPPPPPARAVVSGPAPGSGDDPGAMRTVLGLLGTDPCSVDDLVAGCQLPLSTVMGVLADLELAGRLDMLPGGQIALLRPPIAGATPA